MLHNNRSIITFYVPDLTRQEQYQIWQRNLSEFVPQLNRQLQAIVSQFKFSQRDIEFICYWAKTEIKQTNSEIGAVLWYLCIRQTRSRFPNSAERIESKVTWDNLVLPEAQEQKVRDIISYFHRQNTGYRKWDFANQKKRSLGIVALFDGTSGTGKTMTAEVIANELKLDLYRIKLYRIISEDDNVTETEKNLGEIFDAAERGGGVLLFDDAEVLFDNYIQVKDGFYRYNNFELRYILKRMAICKCLTIITTNLGEKLDRKFASRMRFVVNFPVPDAQTRTRIWQKIYPPTVPTEKLDYQKLGNLELSGGFIYNIALNAAFLASHAEESVMMKHILEATRLEYEKLRQVLTDTEIEGWV